MSLARHTGAALCGAVAALLILPAVAGPGPDGDAERVAELEGEVMKLRSQLISLQSLAKRRGPANVPVVRVVDGDTIIVRYAPRKPLEERVTLLGLETPKRGKKGHADAKKALEQLLKRKRVSLEFEPAGSPRRTLYGSLPAYLKVGERNVNVEMVRGGWSRFAGAGENGGRYRHDFAKAEKAAQEANAGLWKRGSPPKVD